MIIIREPGSISRLGMTLKRPLTSSIVCVTHPAKPDWFTLVTTGGQSKSTSFLIRLTAQKPRISLSSSAKSKLALAMIAAIALAMSVLLILTTMTMKLTSIATAAKLMKAVIAGSNIYHDFIYILICNCNLINFKR